MDTAPRQALVVLEPSDRAQLDAERTELLGQCDELPAALRDGAEYQALATLEGQIDGFIRRHEPAFDRHCSDAHRVWKQACEIRALFFDVPKALKARCRLLLGDFKAREAREREAEERRRADAERALALEQREREAKSLLEAGQPEMAEIIATQPIDVPAFTLPSAVPDVAGLSYREDWYWEVAGGTTPASLIRALWLTVQHLTQHKELLTLVKYDDAALTQFAKRTKGTVRVPGLVFKSRQTPVRR